MDITEQKPPVWRSDAAFRQIAERARRILVFRTGQIGDTVCAIPAFRRIREAFGKSHLTLLCDEESGRGSIAAAIAGMLNVFDELRTYRPRRKFLTLWELWRNIRKATPDLVIVLPQEREDERSVRNKQRFFHMCGVRRVLCQQLDQSTRSIRLTEADRLLATLDQLGLPGGKPEYDIPVDHSAAARMEGELARHQLTSKSPYVVFCGGGKTPVQRWPLPRYAQVLGAIHTVLGWPAVAIGTTTEIEAYRRELLPTLPELKLVERPLSFAEVFELLRKARAYFGNDTGPMHMAAAVRCPTAVIMNGRSFPGAWYPDSEQRLVISERPPCEGCFLSECTKHAHRCMMDISVDRVLSELLPFLKTVPARETTTENHRLYEFPREPERAEREEAVHFRSA